MNLADITPAISPGRVQEIVAGFDLRRMPNEFLANPYPVYHALRERSPVLQLPDGSWFLTRYDDLVRVYRDSVVFSSDKKVEYGIKYNHGDYSATHPAPLYDHHTRSLVFSDPPLHTRVRRIIMGALTRRAIAEMEPALVRLVDTLLDSLEARGGGDLIADYASAIPVEVIGNLLNVPHADRGPLRAWSLAILGALEPAITPAQEALGNQSLIDFLAYLRDLVAERRRHPGNPEHDVLTRLIDGEAQGDQLNEMELLQNCVFLLNAGHETTTNLIGNALICLIEHPAECAQLKADVASAGFGSPAAIEVLDLAVDEFLRFESSNQLGNRRALQACEVGGVALPEGALITLCIGAANRDPAQFDQPDVLDLRRRDNRHLSFGFGIHQCAGLSLARLEGRIAVGHLLQRFPDFKLLGPPQRGMRARFRGFLSAPFTP